jgi:hypothetical protein
MRKQGVIRSWHEERGFGVIVGTASSLDRYFLHISNVRGTVPPAIGLRVEFDPGPPLRQGDLPPALNIVVLESAGTEITPEVSPKSENVGGSL